MPKASKNQRKGSRCTCYRVMVIRQGKRVKGPKVFCGLSTCHKPEKKDDALQMPNG